MPNDQRAEIPFARSASDEAVVAVKPASSAALAVADAPAACPQAVKGPGVRGGTGSGRLASWRADCRLAATPELRPELEQALAALFAKMGAAPKVRQQPGEIGFLGVVSGPCVD